MLTFAGSYHMLEGEETLSWSRMGSAGMTKLYFIGFCHPSSRQARAYSHGGWTWWRLRLRTGILPIFHCSSGHIESQHQFRFEE